MWAIWKQPLRGKADWVRTNHGQIRKFRYKIDATSVAESLPKDDRAEVKRVR